ncbi:SKOR [Symbiodinium sp. KB8]|nr:SKOR [Symbiodinium sp. KB8]
MAPLLKSSLSKHFSDFPEELQDGQAIFVIKPFSAKKITWDLLICCIVLHDGIVLPLQLLGIEVSTSDMLAWPLTLAWTVDLVVSSIITFERNDGTWETRVRYTFRRYFAGSFLPDFVLAALAWVERFTFSQRLGFKFLRICRLFRLYRIEAIIQLVSNNIRSERAVLCIGISGKIMWLAVFLHFIACLWLSLGRQEGGWVSYHKPGIADIQQYSIAFHWTLAQFHGSMELYPVTVEERIFAFCYLLMAYILAVVFISSMTSAMTRLYLITGIQAGHQRVLRWFLIDNGISRQLTARIHSNLKASLTAQSHAVPETEVEFLQLVSENLRMELHCEMYGPALRHHPLLAPMTAQMVKQLCHTAISLALISHGDLVFIQGEVPVEPRMVFITDGDLVYFRSGKFESMSVHPGDHAAEPVLWTDWLHHGTLRVASMRVRLLLLSAKTFQELAQKNTCPEIESCSQGSIMRLGPVPVAYHLVPAQALEVAGWQSLATHPGAEAALCCRFIASFCVAAIACHRDAAKASDAELTVLDPIGDTRAFLENHINAFLQQSDAMALPKKLDQDGSCARRLQQLLMSQAPSRKEAHWNWKVAKLPIADSIAARQGIAGVDLYNGHPTIATYFGAYCMDGLAMALWALWSSNSYSSAVRAGVNLLGDADTVGAIVGQMAGALYGWKQIKSEAFSERCVRNLKYWDKCAEIGLRAALLYHLGPRPRGSLKPADGESKAKLYQRPSGDVPLAGELPAGEWVTCVDAAKDFVCVSHEGSGLQGWVPKKSIADWAPAAGTEELSLFVVSGTEAVQQWAQGANPEAYFARYQAALLGILPSAAQGRHPVHKIPDELGKNSVGLAAEPELNQLELRLWAGLWSANPEGAAGILSAMYAPLGAAPGRGHGFKVNPRLRDIERTLLASHLDSHCFNVWPSPAAFAQCSVVPPLTSELNVGDLSDVSVDKISEDLQRVRLDLAAVKAGKHLQRQQGRHQSAEKPTGRARTLRPKDPGAEEHGRYLAKLKGIAAELLTAFDANADGLLDVQEAGKLFRRLAGRKSQGTHAPTPVERGALSQLQGGSGLGESELVRLVHLGGGALGHVSQTQGRYCADHRPFSRPEAVTCRLPDTEEVPAKPPPPGPRPPAKFGEPPPWQSRARVLQGPLRGRKSHREQLRNELRCQPGPPAGSALNDNVVLAQVGKAVRDGDASALSSLVKANSLWAEPNPSVISMELQQKLATGCYRFPLLFTAAYSGAHAVWQLLLREISSQPQALTQDVEGWTLPMVLCVAPPAPFSQKDSKKLLCNLLEVVGQEAHKRRSLLAQCLLLPQDDRWEGDAAVQPLHLLLERENWSELVAFLVEAGGGFPHDEAQPRMALVSTVLAERGLLGDFLAACAQGGDVPRPQTQAFAGLYLGILKNCVPWVQCLSALQALLKAGLAPSEPLTPSRETWPLHAAGRHNCRAAAQVLLVAKADPFVRNARGQTALDVLGHGGPDPPRCAERQDVHAERVAADINLVANALVTHLEDIEAQKDLVASALVTHLEAVDARKAAEGASDIDLQEAVIQEHEDAATKIVANALAGLLGAFSDESSRRESIPEHEAVESDHTDAANVQTVARILAGLVTAAESDVGSLMGQLEDAASDSLQHEAVESEHTDDANVETVARVLAGLVTSAESDVGSQEEAASDSIQHEAVESEHTDDANVQTVACVLAGLLSAAEPDVGSLMEGGRDSIQHEAVESEHTDDANVQTVARVLAGLVTAAQRDVGPLVQVEEATHDSLQKEATESARADVARVVAGLVTAAESDVGSLVQVEEAPRDSIQHEAVESEHTDDANVQTVARVLAGLVMVAESKAGSRMGEIVEGLRVRTQASHREGCPSRSEAGKWE